MIHSWIQKFLAGHNWLAYFVMAAQLLLTAVASILLKNEWVFAGGALVVLFNFYYSWHPIWILLPVLLIAWQGLDSGQGWSFIFSAWLYLEPMVQGFMLAGVIGCAHWLVPFVAPLVKVPAVEDDINKKANEEKLAKHESPATADMMDNGLDDEPGDELAAAGKNKKAAKENKEKPANKESQAAEGLMADAEPSDKVHLGQDLRSAEKVLLPFVDMAQHTAIFGSTGTGKTTTILNFIEYAAINKIALIYVDGKGDPDLPKLIKRINPDMKHFSMKGNDKSWCYNPFALGSPTEIKDKIMDAFRWSEEYYRSTAESYLQLALKALMEGNKKQLDIADLSLGLNRAKAINAARKNYKKQGEKERVIGALQDIKDKDIGALLNQVNNLAESEVCEFLRYKAGRTISFADVIEEGGMCLLSLEKLSFSQLASSLGRLVVSDIKTTLAYEKSSGRSRPVILVLDEFGVFVGENVLNIINMGRSAGANVVLAAQGLADLETEGDVLGRQIINNCNTFLVHRINTPAETETIAGIIGTRDGVQVTRQVKGGEGSVRSVKEYIIHPDEIKGLKKGQAILIARANEQLLQRVQVKMVTG